MIGLEIFVQVNIYCVPCTVLQVKCTKYVVLYPFTCNMLTTQLWEEKTLRLLFCNRARLALELCCCWTASDFLSNCSRSVQPPSNTRVASHSTEGRNRKGFLKQRWNARVGSLSRTLDSCGMERLFNFHLCFKNYLLWGCRSLPTHVNIFQYINAKKKMLIRGKRVDSWCRFFSFGWPTLPHAALVLRAYSAASIPLRAHPPALTTVHALSEGVLMSSPNSSGAQLENVPQTWISTKSVAFKVPVKKTAKVQEGRGEKRTACFFSQHPSCFLHPKTIAQVARLPECLCMTEGVKGIPERCFKKMHNGAAGRERVQRRQSGTN